MSAEEEEEHVIVTEPELDPEDEPQLWENFQSASQLRRGEKEFEPDNTEIQNAALQQSLSHMFNALESPRTHTVKQNVRCFFGDDKALCELKGSYLQNMGTVKGKWCHLTPEEAIYLVERGTLEPYWIISHDEDFESVEGSRMDLQSVYALVVKNITEYQVYANLKRCGFIVLRHDKERERSNSPLVTSESPLETCYSLCRSILRHSAFNIFRQCFRYLGVVNYIPYTSSWLFTKFTMQRDIFRSLQLPFTKSTHTQRLSPIDITYDVWKPDPSFSKKTPPIPDFQIVVQDVHTHKLPTKSQLQDIFSRSLYVGQEDEHIVLENIPRGSNEPNSRDKNTKNKTKTPITTKGRSQARRLKEGYNGILFALVDNGVINYVRISEGMFEKEDVIPKEAEFKRNKR